MIRQKIKNFDLAQSCQSGQCFRMKETADKRYYLIAGRRYLELERREQSLKGYDSRFGMRIPYENDSESPKAAEPEMFPTVWLDAPMSIRTQL